MQTFIIVYLYICSRMVLSGLKIYGSMNTNSLINYTLFVEKGVKGR